MGVRQQLHGSLMKKRKGASLAQQIAQGRFNATCSSRYHIPKKQLARQQVRLRGGLERGRALMNSFCTSQTAPHMSLLFVQNSQSTCMWQTPSDQLAASQHATLAAVSLPPAAPLQFCIEGTHALPSHSIQTTNTLVHVLLLAHSSPAVHPTPHLSLHCHSTCCSPILARWLRTLLLPLLLLMAAPRLPRAGDIEGLYEYRRGKTAGGVNGASRHTFSARGSTSFQSMTM